MSEIKFLNSSEFFKIENVYCIGKNYFEHIKEMEGISGGNDIPAEPVIFMKPNTSVICNPEFVRIPEFKGSRISNDLQNEVELVVLIGKNGRNIPIGNSEEFIKGFAVGIDFTLRDIQTKHKRKGLPWTLSKGFITSAPVSFAVLPETAGDCNNLNISLKVNSDVKQNANTSQMIFKVSYLIHYLSCIFGLVNGDIIFTGTPAGVSKLNTGDILEAEIENIGSLRVKVA